VTAGRRDFALALTAAVAVSLALWRNFPVSDDWGLLLELQKMEATGHFFRQAWLPQQVHWSPLWFLLSHPLLALPDYGRLPLTFFRIAGLTAMFSAALFIVRNSGGGTAAAIITTLLLAFHQGGVGAFAQWKCIGAIGANAAGGWAAAMMLAGEGSARRRGVLAAALLALALLFKETALCYAAFAALLLLLERRRAAAATLPALAVAAAFVALRAAVGTPATLRGMEVTGAERYSWASLLQMPQNAGSLLLGTVTPVSTLRWFDAIFTARSIALLAAFFAVTLLVNLPVAFARDRRLIMPLLGLAAAPFPVLVMVHVSENYLTPAIFWYAIVVAIAAGHTRMRGAGALIALAIVLHLFGFAEKSAISAASSHAESDAAWKAIALLRKLPAGTSVAADFQEPSDSYSSYRSFRPDVAARYLIARFDLRLPMRVGGDYVLAMSPADVTLTSRSRPAAAP
jgi:hypothetical protein